MARFRLQSGAKITLAIVFVFATVSQVLGAVNIAVNLIEFLAEEAEARHRFGDLCKIGIGVTYCSHG